MRMYEYKIVSFIHTLLLMDEGKLNELGKDGWELCSIQAENPSNEWRFVFKREVKKD